MSTDTARRFPSDFVWGAATASYQIEGAADEHGRGESVWDRFSAMPGKVRNGDTGAIACDFYHRYPEDVALMRELGLDAFRFSIAWPRVLPDGRGRVNQAGLDFYDRLLDELLGAGIEPYVTLFHWDTPQALEDEGGWPVRSTAEAFPEYVEAVAARLGDRVGHWITHNEPWVVSWLGYGWGMHAPGRSSDADALATAHNLLLSHGWAVDVLRRESPASRIGITLNLNAVHSATEDPADVAAALEADGFLNRWYLDPIFRGEYPADAADRFGDLVPQAAPADLTTMAAPIDFLGVNNYSRTVVRANADGSRPDIVSVPDAEHTEMGWEVYPEGLYELLVRLRDDYDPPAIHITENGAAFGDVRRHDGRVGDPERQSYIERHVDAVGRAVAGGVPVKAYFVWSFLDNFEWAHGYSKRFGLVYVDYPTLERIPKDSFEWYRDFIAATRAAPKPAPAGAAGVR
jgi:beta-glucosidase